MITASELRHRVTIRQLVQTKDADRGFVDGAPTVLGYRQPAHVLPLSGRELERAQQIDPRISHRVRIRYRTDVEFTATKRIEVVYHGKTGDRTFTLMSPPLNVEERNVELQLLCAEAA